LTWKNAQGLPSVTTRTPAVFAVSAWLWPPSSATAPAEPTRCKLPCTASAGSGPLISGALSFSNHWFTTNRSTLGDALTASFVGQGYGARLEGGYRYAVLPAFAVTPYGAVQFQDSNTPTFGETDTTGGGLGLNFAAQNSTDVRTEFGARFDDGVA
jgi:uncharacterized protein with beta-barrel porin domain